MSQISITGYKSTLSGTRVETRMTRSNIVVQDVVEAASVAQIEEALKNLHERCAGQVVSFVLRVVDGRKPRGFDSFVKTTPLTLLVPPQAA